MGRGRSKVSGGGAGGAKASGGGGEAMARHVGKKEVDDWMEQNNPGDFMGIPPDSVVLGGVKFDYLTSSEMYSSDGKTKHYVSEFQSGTQATNGEYPVFRVTVNATTKRKTTTITFDRSAALGTGLV